MTSLRNLILALSDEFRFTVVASDRDLGASEPYSATQKQRTEGFPATLLFADPLPRGLRAVHGALTSSTVSIVYLNSFFSPLFTLWPLILKRLGRLHRPAFILAPRGELLPGALETKSWRKRVYLFLFRLFSLSEGVLWKASNESEAARIRQLLGSREQVHKIRDLPTLPLDDLPKSPKSTESLRVLYLSRIARNKNLAFVIKVLRMVGLPLQFTIAGPVDDDGYWRKCRSDLRRLPKQVNHDYLGPVDPAHVFDLYRSHHVLFLPTEGENYGHVVVEALMSGCPALISQKTPWRHLKEAGVGWDLPLEEPLTFASALRDLYFMNPEVYQEMSRTAQAWGRGAIDYEGALRDHRAMLEMGLRERLAESGDG